MCVVGHKSVAFASHQRSCNFPEHLSNFCSVSWWQGQVFCWEKSSYLFSILSSCWLKCFTNVYINSPDVLRATDLMLGEDKKVSEVLGGELLRGASVSVGCKTLSRWAATESHSISTTQNHSPLITFSHSKGSFPPFLYPCFISSPYVLFVSLYCRSGMFQELHLQQWCHKVPWLPGEIPKQPGLHIYDLRSQDVWDHPGVRKFWVGTRPNAPCWCVLPLWQAGDLGWLPWRWATGINLSCTNEMKRFQIWGELVAYHSKCKYSCRSKKRKEKRAQALFKVMLPQPGTRLWTQPTKSPLKFLSVSTGLLQHREQTTRKIFSPVTG